MMPVIAVTVLGVLFATLFLVQERRYRRLLRRWKALAIGAALYDEDSGTMEIEVGSELIPNAPTAAVKIEVSGGAVQPPSAPVTGYVYPGNVVREPEAKA